MKVGALVHMYPPLHNAGAEHMLHAILSEMVRRGADCVVAVEPAPAGKRYPETKPYEIDGVLVGPRGILEGCDLLLTHLDRTAEAEALALERGIPLAQIMHNHQRPDMARNCQLAIYNSYWIATKYPTRGCDRAIVVHPPVWPDTYRVTPGDSLTLVNLTGPKGADLFYKLAALLPSLHFIGVRGAYGPQMTAPDLPNLETVPTQRDIRTVYQRTRILLMPSVYESYGRCAIEAAASGIPTIANGTPGLREALGDAGTYPSRLTAASWAGSVRAVLADWQACSDRALELSRSLDPTHDVARLMGALEALPKPAAKLKPRRRIVKPFGSVVMAHPSRRIWAEPLAAQLGCEIVYDRGEGLWDTARRALLAFDPDTRYHLVVQDDALLAEGILEALPAITTAAGSRPVSLYVGNSSEYQPHILKAFDQALEEGRSFVEADGPRWAVAVAHPTNLLERVVRLAERYAATAADDSRLSKTYQALGIPCWYTVPSLVDHRDGPSLVRKGAKTDRRAKRAVRTVPEIDWTLAPVRAVPERGSPDFNPAARYPGQTLATFRHTSGNKTLTVPASSYRAECLRGHRSWEEVSVP